MSDLEKYDRLVELLTSPVTIDGKEYDLADDIEKFFIHNTKSAGARIRRVLREVKYLNKDICDTVQEKKKKL